MSVLNGHAGHCPDGLGASGAVGLIKESTEARNVNNLVMQKLRALGHTVYDCTCNTKETQNGCLKKIVAKCNARKVDIDYSIHFNSGANNLLGNKKTTGIEVLVYLSNSKVKAQAQAICDEVAKLGFANRGVKYRPNLYFLRKTKNPALLVECCFVDDKDDVELYNADLMATAIVKGLVGAAPAQTATTPKEETKTNTSTSTANSLYDSWVANLQTELNKQGYKDYEGKTLKVDGIKGQRTLSACPTVRKGAKGNITLLIQKRLNSVGFNLKLDGSFGENTRQAVIKFQKNRGLKQDGIIGSNTWDWLLKGTKM